MAYHEFNDTTNALMVSGLYQYTVRDLGRLLFPKDTMTDGERQQIDDYVAEYEAAQKDNAYTGLLAGKNVIMVQLEAIDTWMLQEAYMPNLAKLKSEGLVFTNHYTPAYISAGTFNTEFMTNSGLLPATGASPPRCIPRMLSPTPWPISSARRGTRPAPSTTATGRCMTGASSTPIWAMRSTMGATTCRWRATSWTAISSTAFDEMTEGDPFYSFVITYPPTAPMGRKAVLYQAHAKEAQAAAQRTDGNYVYAVAGPWRPICSSASWWTA